MQKNLKYGTEKYKMTQKNILKKNIKYSAEQIWNMVLKKPKYCAEKILTIGQNKYCADTYLIVYLLYC